MIIKSTQARHRQFQGVAFDVLAIGKNTMVTRMNYRPENKVPVHVHPNEQSGYVISGKYRIRYQETDEILVAGDSYSIPENVPHSWELIEAGEVIDVFTPVREDYL